MPQGGGGHDLRSNWSNGRAVLNGKRRISGDSGLRLPRYFGMSEQFWTGLQDDFDREMVKDHLGTALDAIHPIPS